MKGRKINMVTEKPFHPTVIKLISLLLQLIADNNRTVDSRKRSNPSKHYNNYMGYSRTKI